MNELDRHGRGCQLIEVVPSTMRGEENERGADALASSGEQVGHRRRHHLGIGLNKAAKACLDGIEISRDRTEDGVRLRL